jgi:hypothetical protein
MDTNGPHGPQRAIPHSVHPVHAVHTRPFSVDFLIYSQFRERSRLTGPVAPC